MRAKELIGLGRCAACGKKLCESGWPLFYTVTVARYGLDADAMRRHAGLALMLGSEMLGEVMGPDEELTQTLLEPTMFVMCEPCGSGAVLQFVPDGGTDQP